MWDVSYAPVPSHPSGGFTKGLSRTRSGSSFFRNAREEAWVPESQIQGDAFDRYIRPARPYERALGGVQPPRFDELKRAEAGDFAEGGGQGAFADLGNAAERLEAEGFAEMCLNVSAHRMHAAPAVARG